MTADASGWVRALGADGGNIIVWGSLAVSVALVAVRWGTLSNSALSRPLGEINWSFTDSWASNLTALGAVLGTILATSGILSKKAEPLTSNGLAALSLFFGFLVLLAPIVYSAVSSVASAQAADTGPRYRGYIGTFLAASAITLWAVMGQIATIMVLLGELRSGTLSSTLSWLFLVALLLGIVLVATYAWNTIRATVNYQEAVATKKVDADAAAAARPHLL